MPYGKTLLEIRFIELPRLQAELTDRDIYSASLVGLDAAMMKACKLSRNCNKRRKKSQDIIRPIQVLRLLNAANWRCIYCNAPKGLNLVLDHVRPLSAGGSNSYKNLVPCCIACNAIKCHENDIISGFMPLIGLSLSNFDFRHKLLLYSMTMLA